MISSCPEAANCPVEECGRGMSSRGEVFHNNDNNGPLHFQPRGLKRHVGTPSFVPLLCCSLRVREASLKTKQKWLQKCQCQQHSWWNDRIPHRMRAMRYWSGSNFQNRVVIYCISSSGYWIALLSALSFVKAPLGHLNLHPGLSVSTSRHVCQTLFLCKSPMFDEFTLSMVCCVHNWF